MDQTRAARMANGRTTRRPGLALAAVVAVGVVAAVQYRRSALTRNEAAQKNSPEHPNLYVSVDRSGGGI
ncbi:hypothetical protein GGR54DRAFT_144404 [Hypoxylon sp. NC1633]|nr:hypothetical protein GGR54DRAFT_144404 [Hypoxylon sp. NC1633]